MAEYILKTAGGGFIGGSNGSIAKYVDSTPPTPSIPSKSVRFKFTDTSYDPTIDTSFPAGSVWTHKTDLTGNIWDFTYDNTSWEQLFRNKFTNKELEVIGFGDMTGITNMDYAFANAGYLISVSEMNLPDVERITYIFSLCSYLENVGEIYAPSLGVASSAFSYCSRLKSPIKINTTANLTHIASMFNYCSGLTAMPIITNVSSVEMATSVFNGCQNIESGIYNMYSALVNNGTSWASWRCRNCFTNCGSSTVTGTAELTMIPTSWGGTLS